MPEAKTEAMAAIGPGTTSSAPVSSGYAGPKENWAQRFVSQTTLLTKKNLTLHLRNKAATVAQLTVGCVFIVLLMLMSYSVSLNARYNEAYVQTMDPAVVSAKTLDPCVPGQGLDTCYTFLFAPDTDKGKVVAAKIGTIAGLPAGLDEHRGYKGFADGAAIDAWLRVNRNMTKMAVVFDNIADWGDSVTSPFAYTLQPNTTRDCLSLGVLHCYDVWSMVMVPLQTALDSAIVQLYGSTSLGAEYADRDEVVMSVSFSDMPHPDMPVSFDPMVQYGAAFFYMCVVFNFIVQASMVAEEKELLLKDAMEQMGMMEAAYWTSWTLCFVIMNTAMSLLFIFCGMILSVDVFTDNSFMLLVFHMWLSTLAFTAFALFVSACVSKAQSARDVGVFVLFITLLGTPIATLVLWGTNDVEDDSYRTYLSLLPAVSFWQGMDKLIGESTGETATGLSFGDVSGKNLLPTKIGGAEWYFADTLTQALLSWFLLTTAAWYFTKILPNSYGRKNHPLFCFMPSYWKGGSNANETAAQSAAALERSKIVVDEHADMDVKTELLAVQSDNFGGRKIAVKLTNFTKVFESVDEYKGWCSCCCCCCCWCRKKNRFTAVDNLSYAIDEGELFCLLGHNGAGKTTSINMLTGKMGITHGDATVFGYSVKSDMAALNSITGLCPQHDILWAQLSGREHLELFARIKGIPADKIDAEVAARLEDVLLTADGDVQAGAYSGGMRRRLSIAIALLGNPKIVYLDEPTTGMDPVTRRDVWDMITRAKRGRVIILTTHSMEEADVLGDRIAVMSHGKLQAIGDSIRLKKRFGAGYHLTIVLEEARRTAAQERVVQDFLTKHVPDSSLVSSCEGVLTFKVPQAHAEPGADGTPGVAEEDALIGLFVALETQKAAIGIEDFSVGLATLEEVFLQLSRMDEGGHASDDRDKGKKAAPAAEPVVAIPVAGTQAPAAAGGDNPSPLKSQLRALFYKTWTYQLRQKGQMFFVISIPVLVIMLLLLMDLLFLSKAKMDALCGKGVSPADCPAQGPDLDCLKGLYEMTLPLLDETELEVGSIGLRGRVPINPNCAGRRSGCFYDMEQPDFGIMLAGSIPGDLATTPSAPLVTWYTNLRFMLLDSSCQDIYDEAFSCDCKGDKACQTECADIEKAQEWQRAQNTQASASGRNGGAYTGGCDFGGLDNSGNARLYTPTDAILAKIQVIEDAKAACDLAVQTEFVKMFKDAQTSEAGEAWNLGAAITAAVTNAQGNGVIEQFSTNDFMDANFKETLLGMLGGGMGGGRRLMHTPQHMMQLLNQPIWEICQSPVMGCPGSTINSCPLAGLVTFAFPSLLTDGVSPLETVQNMCSFATNIDAVRALSTETHTTGEKLRQALFDSWYGEEISTEFMVTETTNNAARAENQEYLHHFYTHHFGAYEFYKETSQLTGVYDYRAYFNNSATKNTKHGNWVPLVQMMDSAVVKTYTGRATNVAMKTQPNQWKCNRDAWLLGKEVLDCPGMLPGFLSRGILDFVMIQFLPLICCLFLVVIMCLVVFEKEHRLRMIMKMMGLKMQVYWVVTYVFYYVQYCIMIAITWAFGAYAGVQVFNLHSPWVILIFFLLWGHVLVSFSMLCTVFFTSTRTAIAAALLIVLASLQVGQAILANQIGASGTPRAAYIPLMLYPPWVMLRVVIWICLAGAFGEEVNMTTMWDMGDGVLPECALWLLGHWGLCLTLLWYLENTWVAGFGVRKTPCFCFEKGKDSGASLSMTAPVKISPRDDAGRRVSPEEGPAGAGRPLYANGAVPESLAGYSEDIMIPDDVKAEIRRTLQRRNDDGIKLRIAAMQKIFPARGGNPEKVAVQQFTSSINKSECFGLLGQNGAGKTTLINMITGLFPPSLGNSFVEQDGDNTPLLQGDTDMVQIHQDMGVCPQHDVLWTDLTAAEHLQFYGRLKGLTGRALDDAVRASLKAVDLVNWGAKKSGTFSGGMKRRLSVAIALMGGPSLVYLDEPSTGLDPASKHNLWDVISHCKGGKSLILTTHSMEEADVLCNRILVMAAGVVLCIGNSFALKRRFGKGYTFKVSTVDKGRDPSKYAEMHKFVTGLFASASLLSEPIGGTSKFEVDRNEVKVSQVFKTMSAKAASLGISSWALTETTLEEVFLKLAVLSQMTRSWFDLVHALPDDARDYFISGLSLASKMEKDPVQMQAYYCKFVAGYALRLPREGGVQALTKGGADNKAMEEKLCAVLQNVTPTRGQFKADLAKVQALLLQ